MPISPLFSTNHQELYNRQDTAGLYVQDQVELPYGFHVMAGARYQYIFNWNTTCQPIGIVGVGARQSDNGVPAHQARVTPRFGLLWRPQSWVSLYGNYTEGFAANTGTDLSGHARAAVKRRELGGGREIRAVRRKAARQRRLLLSGQDQSSDRRSGYDPYLQRHAGRCVLLVGEARSSGPEVDIQGELLPGWNVIVNYTNQDVRVAEGNTTAVRARSLRFDARPALPQCAAQSRAAVDDL